MQVQPGDTIYVRGGTYDEEEIWINFNFGVAGVEGKFITIMAFPNEAPIFNNPNRPLIISSKYIRIQGLHFNKKNISVRRITDVGMSEYIEIIENSFTGQIRPPIYLNCNHGLVQGNTIEIAGSSDSHGIYIMHGDGNVVRGNKVTGARMYGIHVYDENKYQYANEVNPKITNLLIENNIVRESQSRAGIIISAGESPGLGIIIENVEVRNNIILNNNGAGIILSLHGKIRHIKIFNNDVIGNRRGVQISAHDIDNITIKNNIFVSNGKHHITTKKLNNLVVSHNLYHKPRSTNRTVKDIHAVLGAPHFTSKQDFHLQRESPAIDAGIDVGLPYNGSAPDIGAFEFDSQHFN